MVGTRGNNRRVVMRRHFPIRGIEIRLVEAWLGHTRLQVIRHDDLGDTAEELEGSNVRADPVPQILPQRDLGEGVVAGAQHGHEHGGLLDFTGLWIVNRNRGAGVVDE